MKKWRYVKAVLVWTNSKLWGKGELTVKRYGQSSEKEILSQIPRILWQYCIGQGFKGVGQRSQEKLNYLQDVEHEFGVDGLCDHRNSTTRMSWKTVFLWHTTLGEAKKLTECILDKNLILREECNTSESKLLQKHQH